MSGQLANVYATDEDIAVRAPGDYAELVPKDSLVAQGIDGSFDAAFPWILNSTLNFTRQGVKSGMVVHLETAEGPFRASGAFFAVDTPSGQSCSLRRIGLLSGIGQPPYPGPCEAITFTIRTFSPQLENASYELNQSFRINPADSVWRYDTPANLYDQRQLRDACVLKVLIQQYTSEARSKDSDWSAKAALARIDQDALMEKLILRWGPFGQAEGPSSRMNLKLVR